MGREHCPEDKAKGHSLPLVNTSYVFYLEMLCGIQLGFTQIGHIKINGPNFDMFINFS